MDMHAPIPHDDTGAGAPLVLLHAFPFDRRLWADVTPSLATRVRVLAPDLRGFGEHPLGDAALSMDGFAEDLARWLDQLGLARVSLGGVSMGGYVALAFARRHPHRLDKLILCDTKAAPDTEKARAAREDAIALISAEGPGPYCDRQVGNLLAPHAPTELRARARALMVETPDTLIAALRALRDRPDRRPDLPALTCPTLVLVGEHDTVTPAEDARSMCAALPDARLVVVPGAGHLPPIETPSAFSEAALSFLS